MISAVALLPVKKFQESPENGISLQGIVNRRGFYLFPGRLETFPVVAIWGNVEEGFEQTLKLFDPSGHEISAQSIVLDHRLENNYGISLFVLTAEIDVPGVYRLELYGNGTRYISTALHFTSTENEYFPVEHNPELSALLIANVIRERDNLETLTMDGVMSGKGLQGGEPFSILTVWDNVAESFPIDLELINPNGVVLNRRSFQVDVDPGKAHHGIMSVDLPPQSLRIGGTYTLKVYHHNAQVSEFPIFVTVPSTQQDKRVSNKKSANDAGSTKKKTRFTARNQMEIYLQLVEKGRSDDKFEVTCVRLDTQPIDNKHFTIVDFRDNDLLVDLLIYIYVPAEIPLTRTIWEVGRQAAIHLINGDAELLRQISGGAIIEPKPASTYSMGIRRTTETRFQATTLAPVADFEIDSSGSANIRGLINTFVLPGLPYQVAKLPIITTWMGVEKNFDVTLKVIEPSGRVGATVSRRVEPANPWGYLLREMSVEFLVRKPGIYTLELFANNKRRLTKPIEFQLPPNMPRSTRHDPQLDMCLIAAEVTNVDNSAELAVRQIMSNIGFEAGHPIGFLLSWSYCIKPLEMTYDILDILLRPIIGPITHNFEVRTNGIGLENSVHRIHLGFDGFPFVTPGVYWLRVAYESKTKLFPFYVYTQRDRA